MSLNKLSFSHRGRLVRCVTVPADVAVFDNCKPHIVYLVHRFPYPPDRGDRIRAYHIIRRLAGRCRLSVVAFTDSAIPAADRAALGKHCDHLEVVPVRRVSQLGKAGWSLMRGRSATCGAFASSAFTQAIRRVVEAAPADRVLLSTSGLADYVLGTELRGVPFVADFVDLDSQKWADYAQATPPGLRAIYTLESRRLQQVEAATANSAQAVTLVTAEEAELCQRVCNGPICVATNGVDLEYYRPAAADDRLADDDSAESGPATCVFVGVMDYRPNVDGVEWFARAVWPEVRKRFPSARFRIVGRNPVRRVRRLQAVAGVEVVGGVPDVRPYLHEATVAISPLRIARGLQNKVLEAMACGKAVVASSRAAAGLAAQPERDLLVADSADEWTATLTALFTNAERRRQLGAAARRYAESQHDWADCLAPLTDVLLTQPPVSAMPRLLRAAV